MEIIYINDTWKGGRIMSNNKEEIEEYYESDAWAFSACGD